MKKVIFIIVSILLLNTLSIQNAFAISGNVDASCTNVDQSGYKEVGFEAPDEQTFVPTYDRFTGVNIIVGGHTWGMDGINFTLFNAIGTVVGTGTITPTINGGPVIRTWEPASPISVRKGVTYRLRVENPNNADFVWYATGNNNCYTSGNARQKNADQNFDFGFTTYGYDAPVPATPQPTSTPAEQSTPEVVQTQQSELQSSTEQSGSSLSNTNLNEGSSTGSGEAPSANTSSTIDAPIELKLSQINVSNKPVLYLNWTASKTADIDGYKIYKSDKEKTGFKNIAKVEKKILEYKDAEVEVGKTYYYQIRAYKGTSESKSSNTEWRMVEAVKAATLTPGITISQVASVPILAEEQSDYTWWLWWGVLVVLLLIILIFLLYYAKKWPFNKNNKSETTTPQSNASNLT